MSALHDESRQRLLELRRRQRAAAAEPAPVASPRSGTPCALSFAQEGLWFLDRMEGPSAVYNGALALRLRGPLDRAKLARSLQALVARHDALRSAFELHEGRPVQIVKEFGDIVAELALEVQDIGTPAGRPDQRAVDAWLTGAASEPFDLSRAPLLRAHLLRLDHEEHLLLVVVHHIVFDGWSMGVLLRELGALYEAGGDALKLAPLALRYADHAAWQRQRFDGEAVQRQLQFWRQRLAGLEALELPTARPRPAQIGYRGAALGFVLPRALTARLKSLAQREHATLFMLLLAAFEVLLMRHSGQHDFAVGVPVAARPRPELEGLIGCFVNTVVMRADLSGRPTFTELLARVRKDALDAYDNQELPFDRLVAALSPERDLGRHPLYQVSFALNNQPAHVPALSGLAVEWVDAPVTTAKFDLALSLVETDQGLRGAFEYRCDLFDAASVCRMASQFEHLLQSIVAEPACVVMRLALQGEREQQQWLEASNGPQVRWPQELAVHRLIEAQVARCPDSVAAIFEGQRLSYRELDDAADRLARRLRESGAGPEQAVGLCVERSLSTLVALLAILKSGAACVPLDPEHPVERLAFMLHDCGATLVVTQRSLQPQITAAMPPFARALWLDDPPGAPVAHAAPARDLDGVTRLEHLACIVYTSGSTGRPKGVQVEHRSLANHLQWFCAALKVQASDRFLFKTSLSFDAALAELLAPLLCGASVVVAAGRGERDIVDLPALVRSRRVSVLQMVPSALRAMLAAPTFARCDSLRSLVCGGEALDRDLAREVRRRLPATQLGNFYGPTEACIDATWHPVHDIEPGPGTVPIGRPITNLRCHVLDSEMQPVPLGVVGELWIGGAGLARGYLNRPELTAQRFVADPFRPGERLYRSGDLARYLADGSLECRGRADDQVKLRGFRIELGEIEAALRDCPGVTHSAVLLREDRPGLRQLVGYVAGEGADVASLRETLARRLPAHMLPVTVLRLDIWSLMPNGKLDRKALPAPEDSRAGADASCEPPTTPTETALMPIWCELIGRPTIGVTDDFFELGGDSLLAIRLLAQIEASLSVTLRVAALFQAPTIRRLAAAIEEGARGPASCVVMVQPRGTQPALFGVSGQGGGVTPFIALGRALGPDQPLAVLDAGIFADEQGGFTLQELARRMVSDMRRRQPEGPYHLFGYSLGGKIVFEMAVQLHLDGHEVALLALLDSTAPGYPPRAPFTTRAWLHLRHALALGPARAWRYLADRAWRLRKYAVNIERGLFEGRVEASMTPAKAMQQGVNAIDRARMRYVPSFYPGSLLIVRAEDRPTFPGVYDDDPKLGWGALVGGEVRVEGLACRHLQILASENVPALAALLARHLRPGVDLWKLRLEAQLPAFNGYWHLLDPGERRQADAYQHSVDRQRFVIARGSLRTLLSRRLGIGPAEIEFAQGEFGKPFVRGHAGVQFNTSHSGDWVLHAIASDMPVGVDVEASLAGRFSIEEFDAVLAPEEASRLLGLPNEQRAAAFTELWVCKEACVKATGEGLNRALRDIRIAPQGSGYAMFDCRAGAGSAWTVVMIDVGPGHAACLVHPGPARRVRIRSDVDAAPALRPG